ncbi:MAG: discoidin domain-containing protein [Oscillospiraceae bacterium]|nr:discoidin domain-containing protein [Oscillospiraceae bacterium]
MKLRKIMCSVIAAAVTLSSGVLVMPVSAAAATVVRLDPSNASPFNGGRFEGWGTSMGWWGNRLGHSDKMAQQSAEDLYSEDGLGLDIVRYNVGGGDHPSHNHINRSDSKLPTFAVPQYEGGEPEYDDNDRVTNFVTDENGDVVYDWDWDADHDQMNVLSRIKEQNPDVHIEGYTNSPPWFMTNSQCSSGGEETAENLDPSNYGVFAKFLADVTEHMDEIGLHFDSYSPMNEPNPASNYWRAFSPKQEGNLVAQGENQSGLIKALKDEYVSRGIDTLVAGPDETDLGYTINSFNALTDEAKAALDRIDTHTYGGSNRAGVKAIAESAGKNLWMSEVDGNWNGFGLADRIITDLNGMQASAWVLWDIVDFHKDSNFVDPTSGRKTEANASLNVTGTMWGMGMGNHDTETVEWANKYYLFGQFTRYINPGDTLIASSNRTLAAYNKDTGAIKIVVVNSGSSNVDYEFDLSAFRTVGNKVTEIRSNNATGNAAEHWAKIKGEAVLNDKVLKTTAKAGTITTYIIEYGEDVSAAVLTEFSATEEGLSYSYTLSEEAEGQTVYMAVYNSDGTLKYVSVNKPTDTVEGDFRDTTHKLLVWDDMTPASDTIEYDDSTPSPTPEIGGYTGYAVINGGNGELLIGDTIELTLDTDIEGDIIWSVDDDTVAAIAQDGKLTIKTRGTVTVTAEIDGFTAAKTITIPLNIKGGGSQLGIGDVIRLTCNVAPDYDGEVVWAVDNADVAEIDQNGILTIKSSGTVTVSLTVAGVTVTKTFDIPEYRLSGTPSWGNDSNAPKDSDDYRKAADGDLSTYFDGSQNSWVMYDYGAPYKISTIRLAARSGYGSRTVGGTVQGSNDAIEWTNLYTISTAIPANTYTTVEASQLANGYAYRYYRYTNPSDMTNIAEFLIEGAVSPDTPTGDPTVKDIKEFTDNFEGSENIFGAPAGTLTENGNQVYASNLERFGNVFVPVNDTATAELDEAIELTAKDRFRLTFNMFSGWDDGGVDNTFALKDADGNAVVSFTINTGSSAMTELCIGGMNVLSGTMNAQCKSNTSGRTSANGWNHASQPYRNYMGYNKTGEIIIDGTGIVTVSLTGGVTDITAEGILTAPVSIKSLELAGAFNSSRERVVSYDNFDADVITYSENLPEPPEPTEAPVIPEDGTLISLDFDNGDLTSGSTYGKAEGNPTFVEVDGRKAVQFNNSAASVITLTDANGNGLLAGQKEVTVSFSFKPTNTGTSWWFFTAPNDTAQTYQQEHYIGALSNSGMSVERYNGGGSRATANTGAITVNEWNDVIIVLGEGNTDLYINGALASSVASSYKLTDILGSNPVAYIGKANWGSGEYATGYLDNFVIRKGTMPAAIANIEFEDDLSAVTGDITVPQADGVTWESSDPDVVGIDGTVTRQDETTTVTLTATLEENGITYTRTFTVTVLGLTAAADTFTAYAEGTTIKYTSEEIDTGIYEVRVFLDIVEDNGSTSRVEETVGNISGEFTGLTEGKTYKVNYIIGYPDIGYWEGMPVKIVTKTIKIKPEIEAAAYLFMHFMNTERSADDEQIYFSVSTNGTDWTTVNGGTPVLKNTLGTQGARDPYILRGEDGRFFIIATDLSIYHNGRDWGAAQTAGSKSIVIWESEDLVNWSEPRLIEVGVSNAGCVWAPEAIYDPERGEYMVFWASLTGDWVQRMYKSYTKDFVTFTEPEIYIDGGTVSNIDTTIVEDKGVYYRFTKNESKSTVTMMKSNFLDGNWTDVSTYTLGDMTGYEGPAVYKNIDGSGWTLLLDLYSQSKGYKPFVTDDIATGNFKAAADFTFDGTYRHGTVLPITQVEYDAIMAEYGE